VFDEVLKSDAPWSPEPVEGVPRFCACALELVESLGERYAALGDADAKKAFLLQV
jgi:hypothetical protein